MQKINKAYWNSLYQKKQLAWDVGYVSTPLKGYFNQLENKALQILVPGGGGGHEAAYLYENGFLKTFYLDFAEEAVNTFKRNYPAFPVSNIIRQDFFEHERTYDLIVEQAFFTSIIPEKRALLADRIVKLLKPGGKYAGVFFDKEFQESEPPFGALKETYLELIKEKLSVKIFETAYNSIKARAGSEIFFIFEKA